MPNDQYLVRLVDGRAVRAMVGRQAKVSIIKLTPGDRVMVAPFSNDPQRGAIVGKLR